MRNSHVVSKLYLEASRKEKLVPDSEGRIKAVPSVRASEEAIYITVGYEDRKNSKEKNCIRWTCKALSDTYLQQRWRKITTEDKSRVRLASEFPKQRIK